MTYDTSFERSHAPNTIANANSAPERVFLKACHPHRDDAEEGCACQGCGNRYKVDVQVSDDLWDRIKPEGKPNGAGLLCGPCIFSRIEALGEVDTLSLTRASANVVAPTVDDDLISRLTERGTIEYTIELEKHVDLLYRFARHVRNTDEIPPLKWGVAGMWLLAELRELDPERYGQKVFNPPGFGYPSAVVDTEDSEEEGNATPASTVAPVEQSGPSCWHCGVVLAYASKLRCEDCPTECDVEGCTELGCAAAPLPAPTNKDNDDDI